METRPIQCRTHPHSRGKGHSAVRGAAYRSGEDIKQKARTEQEADVIHRFHRRSDDVGPSMIKLPEGSPEWATRLQHDQSALRAELWNQVEIVETRSNARLARDIELGLAYELTPQERIALVEEFAEREVVSKGFVADISFHNYGRQIPFAGATEEQKALIRKWAQSGIPFLRREEAEGITSDHVIEIYRGDALVGYKHYQPHAHVFMTCRKFENGDWSDDKDASRKINHPSRAKEWRYEWPKMQNAVLEKNGFEVRVSATSEAEDKFRDVSFKSEGKSHELYEAELRSENFSENAKEAHEQAKAADEANREFNQFHNEAIIEAVEPSDATPEEIAYEDEQNRAAVWWGLTARRFSTWRDIAQERADIWRENFEQQKNRLYQRLGWYKEPGFDHDMEHDFMTETSIGGFDPPDHDIGPER